MTLEVTRSEFEAAAFVLIINDAGEFQWSSDKDPADVARVLRTISYEISIEDLRGSEFPAAALRDWYDAATAGLDETLRAGVTAARQLGCSWTTIGEAFGITRQAAWERFRRFDQLGIVDPVEDVLEEALRG